MAEGLLDEAEVDAGFELRVTGSHQMRLMLRKLTRLKRGVNLPLSEVIMSRLLYFIVL